MRDISKFDLEYEGERFTFEPHAENPAHEARIRWKNIDQGLSGEWGRLYLPEHSPNDANPGIRKPTIVFGGHEPITIGQQKSGSIELPRSLAVRLQAALDEFGTATIDTNRVCNDASCFPSAIHYETKVSTEHLDRRCWDPDRYLMWYSPNKPVAQNVPPRVAELISQLDVYGYQIVKSNGKLIHRTEEYPSNEAVNDLRNILQRTILNQNTKNGTDSYRINHHLN